MAANEDVFVPDMDRRTAMNLILAGSIGVNVLGLAVPYIAFFVPPGAGGGGGGVTAKDAIGNDVTVDSWLATHPAGSRELAEGIKVWVRVAGMGSGGGGGRIVCLSRLFFLGRRRRQKEHGCCSAPGGGIHRACERCR